MKAIKAKSFLESWDQHEGSFEPLLLINSSYTIENFNQSLRVLLNIQSKKSILGHFITEVLQFEQEYADLIPECFNTKKKIRFHEVISYLEDQKKLYLSVEVVPLFSDDLEIVEFVLMRLQDKTIENEIHQKLKSSIHDLQTEIENKNIANTLLLEYERMGNASKDCITLIDKEFVYRAVNDAYITKRKKNRCDVVGKSVLELWGDFIFNTVIKRSLEDCFSGNSINYQTWIKFNEDEDCFMDVTYAPFYTHEGDITHVVVTSHDITDMKLNEIELQKSLTLAEAAKEAKSAFLANMSHEIRTPMNSIVGIAEILSESDLSKENKENVNLIIESSNTLLKIINDILDFSKVESGKLDLEKINFNFRNTIDHISRIFAHKLKEKNVELSTLIHSNIDDFYVGDPVRIKQILINLINNAIKFTNEGDITLKAQIIEKEKDESLLRVEIRDTGVGIEKEKIDNLFKPFEQADNSITRKYGGTGLGLAICRQLANLMQGEIGCESTIGMGSTFWFTIRLQKGTAPVEELKRSSHNFNHFHLFAYDKNTSTAKRYEDFFSSWGIHCQFFQQQDVYLEKIKSNQSNQELNIYLLRLDEFDEAFSQEVNNLIKTNEKDHHKSIMLLSSGKKGEAHLAQDLGFSAYLTQPIELNQVLYCFQLIFNKRCTTETFTKHDLKDIKGDSIKILIVDDTETNLIVASKILNKIGYKVDLARNGQEAIDFVPNGNYALILMDLHMPVMNGYDATKEILKKNDIPIIALTADITKDVKQNCKEAGMLECLNKPFKKAELVNTVNQYVFKVHQ